MSDNEDFLMSDGAEDSFEYDDSDDDMNVAENDPEPAVNDLETKYYTAKSIKEDDVPLAISQFELIYREGSEDTRWRFKAAKQLMKLYYLNNHEEFFKWYSALVKLKVDKEYFFDSNERILSKYSKCSDKQFLEKFIGLTSEIEGLTEKLDMKVTILQLNVLVDSDSADVLDHIGQAIEKCRKSNNEYNKNNFLLEIYSIELLVLFKIDNIARPDNLKLLRATIAECEKLEASIILHPKTLGIVNEARGKLQLINKNFPKATELLLESFKNYDEIGLSDEKLRILKPLILISFLNFKSEINVLQSNEIKPYLLADPVIVDLVKLLELFDNLDIAGFLTHFKSLDPVFAADNVLSIFQASISKSIKFKLLTNLFKSFKCLKIDFLLELLFLQHQHDLEDLIYEMIDQELLTVDVKFDYVELLIHVGEFPPLIPEDYDVINLKTKLKFQVFNNSLSDFLPQESEAEPWFSQIRLGIPSIKDEKFTHKEKVEIEKSSALSKQTSSIDTENLEGLDNNNDDLSALLILNMKLSSNKQQEIMDAGQIHSRGEVLGGWIQQLGQLQNAVFNRELKAPDAKQYRPRD